MSRSAHPRATLERNMARWPWESDRTDPPGEMQPLDTTTLLGSFSVNRRLGLLDLRVAAFVIERWREQAALSSDEPARLNLYELGWAIYGRKPGKSENDAMREAIQRLFEVEIDAKGIDVRSGRRRLVARKGRIFSQVDCEFDELEDAGPAEFGALRGATYEIHLGPWLAEQIKAGGRLDLDLAVMRRLRKLAERLWLYLEAEAFVTGGEDGLEQLAEPIPVAQEFIDTLRINCARAVDARRAINQAGIKICQVDARYEAIVTERTPEGGHILRAVRRTNVVRLAAPRELLVEEVATAT
jgi:hypothetical protein